MFHGDIFDPSFRDEFFRLGACKGREDLIFAGNVENNILFQADMTQEKLVDFHTRIALRLKPKGIYAFSTNDVFWHHREKVDWEQVPDFNNGKGRREYNALYDVLRNIDESGDPQMHISNPGLEVLLKYTQNSYFTEPGKLFGENCAVFTARRGDYDAFPKANKISRKVQEALAEYPDLEITEKQGSYNDFKATLPTETNLVMVKIGSNKYRWWNVEGNYYESFPRIAETRGRESDLVGFRPDFGLKLCDLFYE
ncbi:hypothetical protein JXB41_02680 [Candidatus Woesearchaeota archaeon]|nr:hypothetical protein [Candidatus Woesearchaeota archaeon]